MMKHPKIDLTNRTLVSITFIAAISASTISCAKENENVSESKVDNTITASNEKSTSIEDPMAHGEEAHKVHCYKCHTDEIYTRDDRVVKSLDALSQQVDRCKDGTGAPWFDEDAAAVTQFLNEKYYRF